MHSNTVRPAMLLLSSTLLAIAAEPLPSASSVSAFAAGQSYVDPGRSVSFSSGDVDGDGYIDIALGGRVYWGSASGWSGSSYFEPEDPSRGQQQFLGVRAVNPYETLWIVPNVSGQEGDGKSRADLIGIDVYGDGRVLHAAAVQTADRVELSEAFPSAIAVGLVGEPAVGDFNGDAVLDIAWVSSEDYSYVNLALGTGDADGFEQRTQRLLSTGNDYAAVAGITDDATGGIGLAVVTANGVESSIELYKQGVTSINGTPDLTQALGFNLYRPALTVGDITDDGQDDVAVTSPPNNGTGETVFVIPVAGYATASELISGPGVGWIIPDVTGDQVSDVSWGDHNLTMGLIHGGDSFAVRNDGLVPAVDRPVPVDQQSSPEYPLGYDSGSHSFRLAAVPFAVNELPFTRQLLAIDFSGYAGSYADTRILPTLYPEFVNTGSGTIAGSGPLVDPAQFSVVFTGNGLFDFLVVSVYNAEAGDDLTYDFLPTSVDPETGVVEINAGGLITVEFSSSNGMTEDDLESLIEGLSFAAAAGGGTRNLLLATGGRADSSDLYGTYVGADLAIDASSGTPVIEIDGVPSGTVGGSVPLSITGGVGTYRVSANGAAVRIGGMVNGALRVLVTPTRGGTVQVTVTDAHGTSATYDITVDQLPPTSLPAPTLTVSTGTETVFGPVCPGTTTGLANLRSALRGGDPRRTRGFSWDSAEQLYVELPGEPDGGLTPNDGVFLASRVDLGLDFTGPAVPTGATILLRAEWNFVGLGPVDDGGTIVTQHVLGSDFSVLDLSENSALSSDITLAYRWNGASYVETDTIESGVGYWIRNVASDGQPRLLRREPSARGALSARGAAQFARNAGTPPAPPSAATRADADGGSCGAGSGIGALLAGLLAFLRLRSRQR